MFGTQNLQFTLKLLRNTYIQLEGNDKAKGQNVNTDRSG